MEDDMAEIFDIQKCPVCNGEGTVDGGQMMKDAKIYQVMKICPKCKGHGKIGVRRCDA
jgi:DnaJ-class molecular chaperone